MIKGSLGGTGARAGRDGTGSGCDKTNLQINAEREINKQTYRSKQAFSICLNILIQPRFTDVVVSD